MNNWSPQVNITTMVMPTSGCNNNNIETIINDPIDHNHPGNSFFSIHNESNQALTIT